MVERLLVEGAGRGEEVKSKQGEEGGEKEREAEIVSGRVNYKKF